MKLIFSTIICLHIFFAAFAQSGNFFLSHYSPSEDRLDNICFQVRQRQNGIMYFATRSGILEFDGKSWSVINGQGAIYTIQIAHDGMIYWGGAHGYGVVAENENNIPELKVLSTDVKDIFQSVQLDQTTYFLAEDKIFEFKNDTRAVTVTEANNSTGSFTGIFDIAGSVLVNTSKGGIFRVSQGQLQRPVTSFTEISPIVFSSSFKDQTLIGTGNNEIFVVAGNKSRKIVVEDQQYLNEGVLTSGSWVNDDLVVLGMLRGGMMFLNLTNGKTYEIINYSTGLPDNEIFTVLTDQSQCVWAAHEYGFTRVAPYLPFRSFSHYPGLEGNLLCAISFKKGVYVGTSLGLYKLEKEEIFEEKTYYANVKSSDEKKKQTKETEAKTQEDPKRKGFFRLFRRRNSDAPAEGGAVQNETAANEKSGTKGKRKVVRTEKILISSSYRYKKVKNIDAKINRLHSFRDRLVACGVGGTYEIDDLSGQRILADPARYIYGSNKNQLFISTYADEVKTLYHNGAGWIKTDLLQNLNDQVTHIFEGKDGDFWLCALDKIYRLTLQDNELTELNVIDIENPNYDEFAGVELENNLLLVNSNGFYHFDESKKTFSKVDSLSDRKLINYFSGRESIWYRDSHGWKIAGIDTSSKNFALLNLFQNIRFINPDTNAEDLWVITNSNDLYKYFSDRVTPYTTPFALVLKTLKNGDSKLGASKKLQIDQENSALTFDVVQPDYLAAEVLEYRYHITGLDQEWTDWSKANNVIEIPYLPSGDYSLEVESRDIFGKISSMEKVSLEVLPPYWKRPWFYALEVLLFSLFVILSFRMSTRYRIVSRLLMLLTIIMLIQFVETIIGETLVTKTSPVIDFLIQVVIAMMILPIEGYLRELMLRSLDTSHRFYRFIAPKTPAPREEDGEA